MISAYQSALSALQAFGTGINSNADNIANSLTDGFKRTRVTQTAIQPQGVRATVEKVGSQGPMAYEETNNGVALREQSNVDVANELIGMGTNALFYTANLKTIRTADDMLASLLDIKA